MNPEISRLIIEVSTIGVVAFWLGAACQKRSRLFRQRRRSQIINDAELIARVQREKGRASQ